MLILYFLHTTEQVDNSSLFIANNKDSEMDVMVYGVPYKHSMQIYKIALTVESLISADVIFC
jgi:hypothetical protein